MSYRIAQDFEYTGNEYWRWWAWIEAGEAELDNVQEVTWILHHTFKQSRVRVTDRSSKFALKTAGWGTFLLRAQVVLKDGAKQLLKHNLRLEYPKPSTNEPRAGMTGAADSRRPLTVFLSYSAQDTRMAARCREGLKKAGFDVLDQTRLETGQLWGDALKRMISQADAVVGLVGEDEISPWVSAELEAAVAADKPAFVLLPPQASTAGIPSAVRTVQADVNRLDSRQIVELLRSQTRD
jgi:hypothetical protein